MFSWGEQQPKTWISTSALLYESTTRKMNVWRFIHSLHRSQRKSPTVCHPNYHYPILKGLLDFYNYFQHGIDFLISGRTHKVKKIILHSNLVGTCVFTSHISFLTPPISQGLHCFNNTSDARGQSRGSQKMTKMVRPPGHHFYLLTHLTLHGRFSTSEMVLW